MKPNSSWSLKQNDNAPTPQKLDAGAGGAGAGGGDRGGTPLLERRILWFLAAKATERRASAQEIAEGLAVPLEEARQVTRGMVRKVILRELPKTADAPHGRFTVGPRFLKEAATLGAGPDPATL
jgi:hypothetical protein